MEKVILYVITGRVKYELTMLPYGRTTDDALVVAFVANLKTEHNVIIESEILLKIRVT
jgi:hypothetical protein